MLSWDGEAEEGTRQNVKVFQSYVFKDDAYFPSKWENRIKIKTPPSDIKPPVAWVIFYSFEQCCILDYWNCFDSLEEFKRLLQTSTSRLQEPLNRVPVIENLARPLAIPLLVYQVSCIFFLFRDTQRLKQDLSAIVLTLVLKQPVGIVDLRDNSVLTLDL